MFSDRNLKNGSLIRVYFNNKTYKDITLIANYPDEDDDTDDGQANTTELFGCDGNGYKVMVPMRNVSYLQELRLPQNLKKDLPSYGSDSSAILDTLSGNAEVIKKILAE